MGRGGVRRGRSVPGRQESVDRGAAEADSDTVVFGTTPWHRPWLTEHHLAFALSKTRRVMFVEPPLSVLSPLRGGISRAALRDVALLLGFGDAVTGDVRVARPLRSPLASRPRLKRLSAPLVRAQVRRAIRRAGFTTPRVLTARPLNEGLPATRYVVHLVKDWLQANPDLIGREQAVIEHEEAAAWRAADSIVAISEALKGRLESLGHRAVVVRHGFDTSLKALYDRPAAPPTEWATLPRPWLCYAGRIDDRLAFEALAGVARSWSHGSLILIGPVSPRLHSERFGHLRGLPNVHVLEPVTRQELASRIAHCDVLLMPYKADEWSRYGSPLKLWDYLYAGPPLAGSGYVVLAEYPPPLVHFETDPQRLTSVVAEALDAGRSGSEARRSFALANSWDSRAAEIGAILDADRQASAIR